MSRIILNRRDLLKYGRGHHTKLELHRPLNPAERLADRRVAAMAEKCGKPSAQALLRWCLEHQVVAIQKSADLGRQKENADAFDLALSAEDMSLRRPRRAMPRGLRSDGRAVITILGSSEDLRVR